MVKLEEARFAICSPGGEWIRYFAEAPTTQEVEAFEDHYDCAAVVVDLTEVDRAIDFRDEADLRTYLDLFARTEEI